MSAAKKKMSDGASVAEHARRLRQKTGWDPASLQAQREQQLEQQRSDLRIVEVDHQAQSCSACAQLRRDTGDASALCRPHLAVAMGVDVEGNRA